MLEMACLPCPRPLSLMPYSSSLQKIRKKWPQFLELEAGPGLLFPARLCVSALQCCPVQSWPAGPIVEQHEF